MEKDNGIPSYDELMTHPNPDFKAEYQGYLYVKLPPKEPYDNSTWKIDPKTHEVSFMLFTQFFEIAGKAKYIIDNIEMEESFKR